jgi:hypothetical protein
MKEATLLKTHRNFFAALCMAVLLFMVTTLPAGAWETNGKIPGTEVEFSGLQVSKSGVTVRLKNSEPTDVKISLELSFYDKYNNSIGHSIFGVREISQGTYVDITGNYLSGVWKSCKNATRMEWKKMTYEYLY